MIEPMDFVLLVEKMRAAQTAWLIDKVEWKHRERVRLEIEVDDHIKNIIHTHNYQPKP